MSPLPPESTTITPRAANRRCLEVANRLGAMHPIRRSDSARPMTIRHTTSVGQPSPSNRSITVGEPQRLAPQRLDRHRSQLSALRRDDRPARRRPRTYPPRHRARIFELDQHTHGTYERRSDDPGDPPDPRGTLARSASPAACCCPNPTASALTPTPRSQPSTAPTAASTPPPASPSQRHPAPSPVSRPATPRSPPSNRP